MNRHKLPEMSKEEAREFYTRFWELFPYVYRGYDKTVPEFTQTDDQRNVVMSAAVTKRERKKWRNLDNITGFHNLQPNNRVNVQYSVRGERRRQVNGRS
jgi:hypothetical protein